MWHLNNFERQLETASAFNIKLSFTNFIDFVLLHYYIFISKRVMLRKKMRFRITLVVKF